MEGHKIRLGIILLRDHPLPPLLRTSNRIEARGTYNGYAVAMRIGKLEEALAIFAELKMPRQRDAVRAALDKTDAA